jgi:hypothetical protein
MNLLQSHSTNDWSIHSNKYLYVQPYIDSIKFLYKERLGNNDNDNLLSYSAGPIDISICGWTETILIKTTETWAFLLPAILPILKEAWAIENHQIYLNNKTTITIKLTYTTILLYIEHIIVIY